jgi:hypothetical protein
MSVWEDMRRLAFFWQTSSEKPAMDGDEKSARHIAGKPGESTKCTGIFAVDGYIDAAFGCSVRFAQ